MSTEQELKIYFKKLQDNYEKIKEAKLGTDWETRYELQMLQDRVVEKMRKTMEELKKYL